LPTTIAPQDNFTGTVENLLPLIASDGAFVYGVDGTASSTVIGRCPAGGSCGALAPIVAVNPFALGAFAVDHGTLYDLATAGAAEDTSFTIGACPTTGAGCGTSPRTVVEYDQGATVTAAGLAVLDGTLYFATNAGTLSCPTSGCAAPKVLTTSPAFEQFAVDGSRFYWTDDKNNLMACPLAGCADAPTLLRPKTFEFAVDGDALYFLTNAPKDGLELDSCSAADCEATAAHFGELDLAIDSPPVELRLDAAHLYIASAIDGKILRYDRTR
jgi:hypothetical protein